MSRVLSCRKPYASIAPPARADAFAHTALPDVVSRTGRPSRLRGSITDGFPCVPLVRGVAFSLSEWYRCAVIPRPAAQPQLGATAARSVQVFAQRRLERPPAESGGDPAVSRCETQEWKDALPVPVPFAAPPASYIHRPRRFGISPADPWSGGKCPSHAVSPSRRTRGAAAMNIQQLRRDYVAHVRSPNMRAMNDEEIAHQRDEASRQIQLNDRQHPRRLLIKWPWLVSSTSPSAHGMTVRK